MNTLGLYSYPFKIFDMILSLEIFRFPLDPFLSLTVYLLKTPNPLAGEMPPGLDVADDALWVFIPLAKPLVVT